MLWDIIRDWFVMYVFGGVDSQGFEHSGGMFGLNAWLEGDEIMTSSTPNNYIFLPFEGWNGEDLSIIKYVSMADWLSTTATIITLIALCLFLFLAVKWVFNVFRNTLERVGK